MGVFDPDVVRVKVLGVRTAMRSGAFVNKNFSIYSLLVERQSGKIEVIEVEQREINRYAKFIEWYN